MKLFFAAPESGFPSLLTALPSHASFLHLVTKLFFAAPASALPSLLTALVSQVASAIAGPTAKDMIKAAKSIRFTLRLHSDKKMLIFNAFSSRPHLTWIKRADPDDRSIHLLRASRPQDQFCERKAGDGTDHRLPMLIGFGSSTNS
jgi:hypothetical protein